MTAPPGRPSLSVIATVLHGASTIRELLNSLEAQTLQPEEIVFADGGSTDRTLPILREWAGGRANVAVLSLTGCNISQGRNAAIQQASGPIIAVTDAGVTLEPTWLER